MKVSISLSQDDVKKALTIYIEKELGLEISDGELLIEVKSRQNYKSEWEIADFRAFIKSDA